MDFKTVRTTLAAGGMDFLSLSRGGKFDDAKQPKVGEASYPYTGVSGYECMPGYISDEFGPYGRNIEPTAAIRAAVRAAGYDTPVVVADRRNLVDIVQPETTRLRAITREGNRLRAHLASDYAPGWSDSRLVDQVVLEHATAPNDGLYHALKPLSRNLGEVDHRALTTCRY